ncbi:factor associated with metabolism and energy [Ctenodactylus gundi]
MGLSYSKAHPRVTKVAPLPNKEAEMPSADPLDLAFHQNLEEQSSYPFPRGQDRTKALEGWLPPLRESRYGRYSAASMAMYFDIPLEHGETSIIKRHPPRRLQKLWPMDPAQGITSERLLSQQEARTGHTAKQELEKKMLTSMYTSGKRQYFHKMQMLEINRKRQEAQMELKKSLDKEAKINKQKLRDHKAKKKLKSISKEDDSDFLATLPDETLNRYLGNSQGAECLEYQAGNDYSPQKIGKMEKWLREQEDRGQLLWDSSSSDSEEPGKEERKPQPLVRTRTERIPLFDEFFDQE